MPSTASTRLRLELQAAGENLNTWGAPKLNEALKRIEEGIADWLSLTITGNKTLTSSNYVADEARAAMLSLEGTPSAAFTLTIPSVEKWYWIRNASGQTATIKTSGGTGVTVATGVLTAVLCDGTDCYKLTLDGVSGNFSVGGDLTVTGDVSGADGNFSGSVSGAGLDAGSARVTNVASATTDTDAVNRADLVAAGLSSALPGQSGNADKFITTDGANASWAFPIPQQSSSTANRILLSTGAAGSESWVSPVPRAAAITTNTTLTAQWEPYVVDTSGGQITLTLPAGPDDYDRVRVITGESASTNKITFARNGNTIMGLAEDMEVELDNILVDLFWNGSDWRLFK